MSREKIHRIDETFSAAGIRHALSRSYPRLEAALLEITDNSVDARIPGKPVSINVVAGQTSLIIADRGGSGMDLEGLKRLMHWGQSHKGAEDIGQYGVGGKAAMVYFGRRLQLACSSDGSLSRFELEVADWEKNITRFEVREEPTELHEGFVVVNIDKLNYSPKRITPEAIAGLLGSVYRPLLLSGEVQMSVGTQTDKLTRVDALKIPYLQTPETAPETVDLQTGSGEIIRASMGVVDPREFAQNPYLKPGLRVYYRERLIIDGFYAWLDPAHFPNLVGEVHVRNAAVLTNKTGFAADDPNWKGTVDALKKPLGIWQKKLESQKQEDPRLADERRLAESAKRDLEGILRDSGLIGQEDLPGRSLGPGSVVGKPDDGKGGQDNKGTGIPRGPRPSGSENRRGRWGVLSRWEVMSFGRAEPQAEIYYSDLGIGASIADSRDPRLRINTDHPSYERARTQRDQLALREYFTSTAAYHVLMEITRSRRNGDLSYFHQTYQALTTRIAGYYLALSKGGS